MSNEASITIDVRKPPTMIRIKADANGQPVATTGTDHTAVLLPQYGLMFAVQVDTGSETHAEAITRASAVSLFGCTDWRLPEISELTLLIDRTKHQPAIDAEFFPDTPTEDWYWSATEHASYAGYAWYANFGYGYVGNSHRYVSGFVRAVRSVPPSQ